MAREMGWKTSEGKIFFSMGACVICYTGGANNNVIGTVLGSDIHATVHLYQPHSQGLTSSFPWSRH